MERAYDQVRSYAVDNIKNFVAEDIVAGEMTNDEEKMHEYNDGTNAYFSRHHWELAVKAKVTKLNIATRRVRQWKTTYPISQTTVAGCVVVWTLDNAQHSNALKPQLNGSPRTSPAVKMDEQRQQTVRGAITITGSDDDL